MIPAEVLGRPFDEAEAGIGGTNPSSDARRAAAPRGGGGVGTRSCTDLLDWDCILIGRLLLLEDVDILRCTVAPRDCPGSGEADRTDDG